MKPFLYETAEEIINKYGDKLQNCKLIFPNKRTKIYFRGYYAQILGKTSRPAKMIEIGKFIREITEFEDGEKLSLIFELFSVFKSYNTQYTFDNFYRLGEIILSDFNEIDAWLVDPNQIYRNIKDLKEIDAQFDWLTEDQKELLKNFWKNFLSEKSSREKDLFLNLWNLLPAVYEQFTDKLKKRKIAYNGLIYREISKLIETQKIKTDDNAKYIFIGFNALNNAELKLVNYFHKKGIAEFYWDGDDYYFTDKKQEAGDFLRKNFYDLNLKKYQFPKNFIQDKKISVIGTSINLNQAKLLHPLLIDKNQEYHENTAVITADETMLFPILSSLPKSVDKINVTMGYSFKLTPLFNFISKFFRLHVFAEKSKSGFFYYKHVLSILKHPYLNEYNSGLCSKITKYITENKLFYLSSSGLQFENDGLMKLIFENFSKKDDQNRILTNLLNILFILFNQNVKDGSQLTLIKNEYIYRAYKKIKRFREILFENDEQLSLKLMSEILLQILKGDSIPFESVKNEGLQIMGLMESRNLDFKNIIILGMNEGNLPKISTPPTFISQNMRYAFGMPLTKHQDAVFAYFFYRLLQRAENVTLVYNNMVNDSNSGEMSRFIVQLLYETDFKISHTFYNDKISVRNHEPIEIQKDHFVYEKLNRYVYDEKYSKQVKAFSASALNTYLSCSLKFYFKYVAGLKEADSQEDEFTPAEFGSVLHASLELIYKDIRKETAENKITKHLIEAKLKDIENYVLKAFKLHYKSVNYKLEGIKIIIKDVIVNYVKTVLKYDMKQCPFEIHSIEKEHDFDSLLNVKINNNKVNVKLFGIIDRIDKKNGVYKIIDYKSGKTLKDSFSIKSLFDQNKKNRHSHAFQALFYMLIVKNKEKFKKIKIKPALFYVRAMNQNDFSDLLIIKENSGKLQLDENVIETVLPEFEKNLVLLIEEIFNKAIPFSMTKIAENCKYCEFNSICY